MFFSGKSQHGTTKIQIVIHCDISGHEVKYLEYPILQVQVKTRLELTFVLIQPFCLYDVNNIFLMLSSIFKYNFHEEKKEVCIKQGQPQPHVHLKARIQSPQL